MKTFKEFFLFESFQAILSVLTKQERRQGRFLFVLVSVMAILDAVGIASIMPFIAVAADWEVIDKNQILSQFYKISGYQTHQGFVIFLGFLSFCLLILSLTIKATTTYLLLNFALMREASIGTRLFERYITQPFPWSLSQNASDLEKRVLSEVSVVVQLGLLPVITIMAQSMVSITILLMLSFFDYLVAITVFATFGIIYILIFISLSGLLSRKGEERLEANLGRYSVSSEAFDSFKYLKISSLEQQYIDKFGGWNAKHSKSDLLAQTASQLPRFALEAVTFGGILLILIFHVIQNRNFSEILPMIALYAFSGYRLMPAMQQIYRSLSQLKFATAAVKSINKDLETLPFHHAPIINAKNNIPKPKHSIQFDQVWFKHIGAETYTLCNADVIIKANTTTGIVGSSGSGKTTFLDILLGLLSPNKGSLMVDGTLIEDKNKSSWQLHIGYVPQVIYLTDSSIKANIAYGIPDDNIDFSAVQNAAKAANLHEFIVSELEAGYDTQIGENGVRLSGGQRQRIGIARALYNDPAVLIFDEATSALDTQTEYVIMDAINKLQHKKTIILVAHRMNTIRQCNQIFVLDGGSIVGQGNYEELLQSNEIFKNMCK